MSIKPPDDDVGLTIWKAIIVGLMLIGGCILVVAGIKPSRLYEDEASGKKDNRPGLNACLKSLREGDMLVVWKTQLDAKITAIREAS
jgi:hypothetical protein